MSKNNSFKLKNVKTDSKDEKNSSSFSFSWDTKTKPKATFARTKVEKINRNIVKKSSNESSHVPIMSLLTPRKNYEKSLNKNVKLKTINRSKPNKLPSIDINLSSDSNCELINGVSSGVSDSSKNDLSVSENVFSESGDKFKSLNLHEHVLSNLEKHGFKKLTVVQERAIPIVSIGKNVLIRSQTGSGKTLAYALPIVNSLRGIIPKLKRSDGVQALVVVPTRELALQTFEIFTKINTFQWVVTGILCGGEKRKAEKERIRKGFNILIGTSGRLLDHILHTSALKIDNVRCLVIDEADRLMEMGVRKDIVKLVQELDRAKVNADYDPLELLRNPLKKENKEKSSSDDNTRISDNESREMPLNNVKSRKRQTILLSATLTEAVTELAEFTMKDHVFVDALDKTSKNRFASNPESFVIPNTVKQEYVIVHAKERLTSLAAVICEKISTGNSKIFVFMASGQMVDFHYELFKKYLLYLPKHRGKNISSDKVIICEDSDGESNDGDAEEEQVLDTEFFKLHGSMDQTTRKAVFTSFRKAENGVLICTDVAARGLDVPTADYIVQYSGPQSDDDYVHRIGRTGRAGQSGTAIIFLTPEEETYVQKLRGRKVFLQKKNVEYFVGALAKLMKESNAEQAKIILQRRFEAALTNDRELYKQACFAYSSWSRFYNSYRTEMREIFNFKSVNLGHYATSFAIRDPPSHISKVVRGEVSHLENPRLNPRLNIHEEKDQDGNPVVKKKKFEKPKKAKRSVRLVTSEFESGLEPAKKKKKNNSMQLM